MDFVSDWVGSERAIKCLAVVEDPSLEAIALVPEHTIGGDHRMRILDGICSHRGRPNVIRTDNGPVSIGKAMQAAARRNGSELKPIGPRKPNQNANVQSFNGRFPDECLNEHWFTSLDHARAVIETWQREHNG